MDVALHATPLNSQHCTHMSSPSAPPSPDPSEVGRHTDDPIFPSPNQTLYVNRGTFSSLSFLPGGPSSSVSRPGRRTPVTSCSTCAKGDQHAVEGPRSSIFRVSSPVGPCTHLDADLLLLLCLGQEPGERQRPQAQALGAHGHRGRAARHPLHTIAQPCCRTKTAMVGRAGDMDGQTRSRAATTCGQRSASGPIPSLLLFYNSQES